MAVSGTLLTSNFDNVDAVSFTTASVSPAANSLLIVGEFLAAATTAGTANITDSSGLLTWTTQIHDLDGGRSAGIHTAQCGASPGSFTITVNQTGGDATHTGCGHAVVQVTGHDSGTPVVQTKLVGGDGSTNTAGVEVTGTLTTDPSGRPNNRVFCFWQTRLNETITPRANWTELSENLGTAPNSTYETQWRNDGTNEATYGATWATGVIRYIGLAIEIAAAGGDAPVGPPPFIIGPFGWQQQWPQFGVQIDPTPDLPSTGWAPDVIRRRGLSPNLTHRSKIVVGIAVGTPPPPPWTAALIVRTKRAPTPVRRSSITLGLPGVTAAAAPGFAVTIRQARRAPNPWHRSVIRPGITVGTPPPPPWTPQITRQAKKAPTPCHRSIIRPGTVPGITPGVFIFAPPFIRQAKRAPTPWHRSAIRPGIVPGVPPIFYAPPTIRQCRRAPNPWRRSTIRRGIPPVTPVAPPVPFVPAVIRSRYRWPSSWHRSKIITGGPAVVVVPITVFHLAPAETFYRPSVAVYRRPGVVRLWRSAPTATKRPSSDRRNRPGAP
jgi:hypothetical protein